MAEKQKLSEMTTEELQGKLIMRRFLKSYFRSGKNPEFWVQAVYEVEEELKKRGALS